MGERAFYKCPSCGDEHLTDDEPDTVVVKAVAAWLENFTREPDEDAGNVSDDGPWWVNARCLLARIAFAAAHSPDSAVKP